METVNQIEYNGALYNIQDAESQKNLVYSQEETDTGKIWIDGKKIYRKVIQLGQFPNKTTKLIEQDFSNVDTIVKMSAFAISGQKDVILPLPFININNDIVTFYKIINGFVIASNVDTTGYTNGFVIFEYTKTTN